MNQGGRWQAPRPFSFEGMSDRDQAVGIFTPMKASACSPILLQGDLAQLRRDDEHHAVLPHAAAEHEVGARSDAGTNMSHFLSEKSGCKGSKPSEGLSRA